MCAGSTDLPSMSDDAGLDEDLDSSEMGSRTSAASTVDKPTLASDLDASSQAGDGQAAEKVQVGCKVCWLTAAFCF